MQVLKEEVRPFELWYQERRSTQNPAKNPNLIEDGTLDFIDVSLIESSPIQPTIEANITKNEPINSSKIATLTESMVNKAQETITKFEQNNEDQIAKITKSMIAKTQEDLTKFEEIDDIRYNLAMKHHDRLVKIRHESLKHTETV